MVSCTVSPAFEFDRFELAAPGWAPGAGVGSGQTEYGLTDGQSEVITGDAVELRAIVDTDVVRLAELRGLAAVEQWWPLEGRTPLVAVAEGIADDDAECRAVTLDGRVIGFVQWFEEVDPGYRHASIDIYLDPEVHGRGLGRDTVRTVCQYLFDQRGHHRITIDPAAANAVAIACYKAVGFQPVGTLRRYEKTDDGEWRDGLLLDLLSGELN